MNDMHKDPFKHGERVLRNSLARPDNVRACLSVVAGKDIIEPQLVYVVHVPTPVGTVSTTPDGRQWVVNTVVDDCLLEIGSLEEAIARFNSEPDDGPPIAAEIDALGASGGSVIVLLDRSGKHYRVVPL